MTDIKAKLIAVTQPTIGVPAGTSEDLISYCARVSNPSNQDNFKTSEKLLNYCMKNKHWSVFEMVNAVVEVEAPRDITRQLLRHRSFSFQEFSLRYSEALGFTEREFRKQDTKNRQNSLDELSGQDKEFFKDRTEDLLEHVERLYASALADGVAKECARVWLPEGLTMSRLYVNGNIRSWLHYLDVRDDPATQHEHQVLAQEIRKVLTPAFPIVFNRDVVDVGD